MKAVALSLAVAVTVPVFAAAPAPGSAQEAPFDRLPTEVFDVSPPSEWVRGSPGRMAVQARQCRNLPRSGVRRRIVDVAVQEWAFFGFPVLDRVGQTRLLPPGAAPHPDRPSFEPNSSGRPPLLSPDEAARLAASIAGYWAVTPEGAGVIAAQNRAWNGNGLGIRWGSPWSAAFISWVMCEAGLGTNEQFQRAVAHWRYIDQGIRARDGRAEGAAFVAYEIGEMTVEPGDMLCAGRRPAYRSVAERRRQLGVGARSHCDIVVKVDATQERILAIGGNVLRSVSLKVLPGEPAPEGGVRAVAARGSPLFVHLKLRGADPVEADALIRTPTFQALTCTQGDLPSVRTAFVVSTLALATARARALC